MPLRENAGARVFGAPDSGSLAAIVRSFKSAVSKTIRETLKASGIPIWQRNYYEHVIRNPDDFKKTSAYIRLNPARWEFDLHNPNRNGSSDLP
jgi:REP-associated tyrosine transposase